MIKLKSYGINGHMYDWIRQFLTNRTIQVRVGNSLSTVQSVENGTAQGAVISPILFICMANDLPDGLDQVETSLFADDSAIYKSGKNLHYLQKVVQRNLDKIQKWCDKWGFRISTEKTVAVPFTYSSETVKLTVNGQDIKTVKSAKFLGMIFDRKCHGRFVGPMFSIVEHPVFQNFATLLAFVAPISCRLSQLRSLAPVCLGPPKNCKLPSRSRDVIVRESWELKKEIRKYVSLASIELKLSWP